ncbi:hypothetical protein VULLAG_LOCUS17881 [Vulpes lagopus]
MEVRLHYMNAVGPRCSDHSSPTSLHLVQSSVLVTPVIQCPRNTLLPQTASARNSPALGQTAYKGAPPPAAGPPFPHFGPTTVKFFLSAQRQRVLGAVWRTVGIPCESTTFCEAIQSLF